MTSYLETLGEPVERGELASPRARLLADALADSTIEFARPIECRADQNFDVVIFDVEVELPQRLVHPIRSFERIAVLFDPNDRDTPEVLALREDFPWVPHVNLRPFERPRSLCLYDEPFREIRRRWTAQRFVERIRDWLALTAKGRLHQDDQPLEPLMYGFGGTIVLPADVLDIGRPEGAKRLTITSTDSEPGKLFLLADRSERRTQRDGFRAVASVHRCAPQQHGIIRHRPTNVKDLAGFVGPAGLDLIKELRDRLLEWKDESSKDPTILDHHLAIIVIMPKTRSGGPDVESSDVWAFLSTTTVRDGLQKLGLFDLREGFFAPIIGGDAEKEGADIDLDLLNPTFRTDRKANAALNGIKPEAAKLVAIGVGALGSQVAINVARAGFGTWTLIDDDKMMPHNVARHAMSGGAVGFGKAEVVAFTANSLTDGEAPFTPISADCIEPGDRASEVAAALNDAALIIDMSASVSAARHLALKSESPARRASLFLSPTGEDLVLLAEDRGRSIPLDSLEMQYYRALAADDRLAGHFKPRDQRRRYGQSCRDLTTNLPQDLVALHAAIGGRAIRDTLADPAARIAIWRADREGNVRRVDVAPSPSLRHQVGEWTICTDENLIRELARLRESKLPKETGGILLGSFDLENRLIYIAHTIASPPDSEEWPTLYIRGCKGLRQRVEEVSRMTDGMLEYVGEWHSHPLGCPTAPSDDDLQVFAWLTEVMNADGLPATMMIVGDGGRASCFVGEMLRAESLLPRIGSLHRDGRDTPGEAS